MLEIGFGTGPNLLHYPEQVRNITTVDPNPGMHRKAQRRIEQTGIEVDQWRAAAVPRWHIRFRRQHVYPVQHRGCGTCIERTAPGAAADSSFWNTASAPSRVFRSGSGCLNWLERLLADNCHLDRDIRQLIERQLFRSVKLDEFNLKKTATTHGYIYRGEAQK